MILVLAFFVFGPSEFPRVAKLIVRGLGDLRRMGEEVRSTVEANLDLSQLDDHGPTAGPSSLSARTPRVPDPSPGPPADGPPVPQAKDHGPGSTPGGPAKARSASY